MVFTLGVLSFFQIFFLPGALLLRFMGYQLNSLVFFLLIAPLSLGLNYVMTLLFTLMGINHSSFVLSVFVLEVVMLFLMRNKPSTPLLEVRNFEFKKIEKVLFLIASLVAVYYFTRWIKSWGTVIHWTDASLSWNRWALEWANSQLPTISRFYPQVIAIVYSIPYQFIGGTEIEFFSLAAVTGIPILAAGALLSAAFYYPEFRIMFSVALPVFFYSINKFSSPLSGYADAPLAALAMLPLIFAFVQNSSRNKSREDILYILGSVAVGVIAMVKQLGVPMIVFYPVLFGAIRGKWIRKNELAKSVLISGLIAGSWYGIKIFHLLTGADEFGLPGIVETVALGLFERVPGAFRLFDQIFLLDHFFAKIAVYSIIFVLIGRAFTKSQTGKILTIILVGCFLFWVIVASYDTRNISIAIPFFSLLLGYGLNDFLNVSVVHSERAHVPSKLNFTWVWITLLALLLLTQLKVNNQVLLEQQREQRAMWIGKGA